ncbi:hypothetical protein RSK20926_16482 [Roseobacter sp. SK209-2-6]|nr:hypothetical protein RSK20926_16482 [Roseobacter sp. SK209-2-6]
MTNTGLFKSWGNTPDFSLGTGQFFGDPLYHAETRSGNAVVICDQYAHAGPLDLF